MINQHQMFCMSIIYHFIYHCLPYNVSQPIKIKNRRLQACTYTLNFGFLYPNNESIFIDFHLISTLIVFSPKILFKSECELFNFTSNETNRLFIKILVNYSFV